jgi:hypothetical protein
MVGVEVFQDGACFKNIIREMPVFSFVRFSKLELLQ